MQEIIIVAGPNGAGKTSFANEYLSACRGRLAFLNADEIARQMAYPGASQAALDVRAGREMLRRIDVCIDAGLDLLLETTLATLSYANRVPSWQRAGCRVALIYLRLPSVEMSIARVRRRVAQGGHGVPEDVLRKRFSKSLDYLERRYKPVVDEWYVWDSLEGRFQAAERWDA
jgi:predicted ABC-type ATPase